MNGCCRYCMCCLLLLALRCEDNSSPNKTKYWKVVGHWKHRHHTILFQAINWDRWLPTQYIYPAQFIARNTPNVLSVLNVLNVLNVNVLKRVDRKIALHKWDHWIFLPHFGLSRPLSTPATLNLVDRQAHCYFPQETTASISTTGNSW